MSALRSRSVSVSSMHDAVADASRCAIGDADPSVSWRERGGASAAAALVRLTTNGSYTVIPPPVRDDEIVVVARETQRHACAF